MVKTRSLTHPAPGERYLGAAGAVSLLVGAIAICGSPAALWSYTADLCGTLWSLLAG
jgi:hypothetical protein